MVRQKIPGSRLESCSKVGEGRQNRWGYHRSCSGGLQVGYSVVQRLIDGCEMMMDDYWLSWVQQMGSMVAISAFVGLTFLET